MNIAAILKNIDTNVLSEETASAIATAFEQNVEAKAAERVNLEVEKALKEQDEDHASKLKSLLDALDEDHTSKLKQVVEAVTLNHTNKLQKIASFYDKAINEKAQTFSNKIVEEMSNYLDLYLDKIIPQEQLAEAVANSTAKQQLEQIKRILSFDGSSLNEGVQKIVIAGKQKIDEMNSQLSSVLKENSVLKEQVNTIKSALLLEEKTKGMPNTKKEFIVKILEDKSVKYINENFSYVVNMFEREDRQISNNLVKEAAQTAVTKDARVVYPTKTKVEPQQQSNPLINEYVSSLKSIR